uniref:Uncharacterized protein n=1 Tax=Pyramimonas obovata TaxID=1411642 RepID=A0A7S0RUL4_9CHLO
MRRRMARATTARRRASFSSNWLALSPGSPMPGWAGGGRPWRGGLPPSPGGTAPPGKSDLPDLASAFILASASAEKEESGRRSDAVWKCSPLRGSREPNLLPGLEGVPGWRLEEGW